MITVGPGCDGLLGSVKVAMVDQGCDGSVKVAIWQCVGCNDCWVEVLAVC